MGTRELPKRFQPSNWQDATAATISRLQQLRTLNDTLTSERWVQILKLSHRIVQAQGKTTTASEYWNTFTNTARIIVVSDLPDYNPADSFN